MTLQALRAAASDLNGIARGKRLPPHMADKIAAGALRFPKSVLNLDIRGDDIANSPLVLASGDQDGVLYPTGRESMPMPWLASKAQLIPVWMFDEAGVPYAGDPRHALAGVLSRFSTRDLVPVVAMEMEFYLIKDYCGSLAPPTPPNGRPRRGGQILSLEEIDGYDAFFTELYAACAVMDIRAGTSISESGPGQFEVTMEHVPDALKAADDAWLFKFLTRGLARKHGFAATFMSKPYLDQPGSGMHVHFSVLGKDGRNIFDSGDAAGSDALQHAVAGCLDALPGGTAIFAPHGVSYDRLRPGAHAPTAISWAYENRTAAIRIPAGAPAARRIEHRLAGADVAPHLALAVILGGAIGGIGDACTPCPPINGNAYDLDLPQIPDNWDAALRAFETCPHMARIFPAQLIENFVMTKQQEMRMCTDLDREALLEIYLDSA